MFQIDVYIPALIGLLKKAFGERLRYVGLQGSYLRGEATEHSDLDIMVVLDGLCTDDLISYRNVIASLENCDRSCGFISGTAELKNWNPLEICHLLHTTRDYYGTLADLVPAYTEMDVRNFVKMSLGNLYHEICHRFIHASAEKNAAKLPYTYRGVFFILQNLHYLNTGVFAATKKELLAQLAGKDRQVLETALLLADGAPHDFEKAFSLLFDWCKETMANV